MSFPEVKPKICAAEDINRIKDSLKVDGYAVVKIPSINLELLKSEFAMDISDITMHHVRFPDLWQPQYTLPQSSMPGLMGEYGLSQGNAAWSVRTNKEIISLYKTLLNTDQVVCSMDAIGFSQDIIPSNELRSRLWLHVDQNPNAPKGADLLSIQGIFYAESSETPPLSQVSRAGTIVVPGSHKNWLNHDYQNTSHFKMVNQDEYSNSAVKLIIPEGCILLFNSRLVHQGLIGPHRLCFMTCYGRKQDRNEEARKRKIMIYLGGHRSSHWSQYGIYHGWKWLHGERWTMLEPRTIGNDVSDFLEDEVTPVDAYSHDLDTCIPVERLELL